MRYLNSFFITSFIYVICTFTFIYLIPDEQIIKQKSETKKISLNFVEIVKPLKKENKPLVKKEEKPNKEQLKAKKIEKPKRKVVKKELKSLPKKTIKKETKIKSEPAKKVQVAKKSNIKKITPTLVSYEEDFLNKNLVLIKKEIQKHIKYSTRAKRLNIQGEVLVSFKLTRDGIKGDIVTLSGHRLLIKSTIKAIYKASSYFPEVNKDITIKLPIAYKLI